MQNARPSREALMSQPQNQATFLDQTTRRGGTSRQTARLVLATLLSGLLFATSPAQEALALPGLPKRAAAKKTAAGAALNKLPGEDVFNSCKKLPWGRRVVRLNLKPDAGVMDLIDWISSITCAQFVVAVPVAGKKVTIVSPDLITPQEAYRLFFAALDSVGLTVERTGRFLRVIESAKARFAPLPVLQPGQKLPTTARYVSQLVHLKYLDANDFTNKVLNRIKSEYGDIIAYHSTVILTDLSSKVQRMLEIIRQFDTPEKAPDKIWIIHVKNLPVLDVASRIFEIAPVLHFDTLLKMPSGQRRPSPPQHPAAPSNSLLGELTIPKLIADVRSNSMIVVANQRAHDWLVALVRRLDQPLDEAAGGREQQLHVYYCANADCNELAATLGALTGVEIVGSLSTNKKGGRRGPAAVPRSSHQQNPLLFEDEIRVAFDAPTNSLLIMSTFEDWQSLLHVIQTLDAPRKQVYIEATIMEVVLDKNRQIGVSYHAGTGASLSGQNSLIMGGFNANQTMNPTNLVSNLGGLTAALFGPSTGDLGNSTLFKGLPISIPSFGVFLQLLQTNNDVHILSRPDLLIMNNEEGEISVGEVLPFPSATSMSLTSGAGANFTPFTSVQRQPVELKLKLTPSVNESDMIRLDVDQEISDVTSPNYNNLGPATSKRSIKTTIVVGDQQTVVIGGLMADRTSQTVQKIPILGDIPVLGVLFRNTSTEVKKSNILIALTPYVISDLSDLRRVAEEKLRERREFIDRYSALKDNAKLGTMEIDYHRKRGMLEEINRSVRAMVKDVATLRKIRERDMQDESQPIEPPDSPAAAQPGDAPKRAATNLGANHGRSPVQARD